MEVSPFYEKNVDCMHCKKSFPTLKVRSKSIKIEHTETDFQPIYTDDLVNALYYNVFVCQHCGFSFTEDFNKYFAPGVKEILEAQVCNNWIPHNFNGERSIFDAIQAYKLAFLCATIKKEKYVITSGLALRLAWLYRSLKNVGQEKRFLTLARDHYMESFSTEDYASTQMSGVRIMYMIAELSRRLEDYENATRFFSRVIESQRTGGEAKLVDMAKEQWELVRAAREQVSQ
ncbi:DUF2225 domain-containing protein [Lysinibacillus sp. 2017]|uniref:DUF2225 domain-containing protein n=1 Tax=unclassified Lysinibacillus TaxID=2636778 RepID=UPI000D5292DB|nr:MULTISPECIES: DUF2225 domain-containing protein [unclassified Lysinibacillus]AWE08442.1 DUF2225 domain-containing protein [Lysinibacillus sp. 2017]TGN34930.1 DUF2225 domain-containing protein [Lysinibacillus sp. S2017]